MKEATEAAADPSRLGHAEQGEAAPPDATAAATFAAALAEARSVKTVQARWEGVGEEEARQAAVPQQPPKKRSSKWGLVRERHDGERPRGNSYGFVPFRGRG